MILWLTEILAENLFTAKILAENYLDIVSSVSIKNNNNHNHHTKTSYSSFMSFINTRVKPIIIFSIRLIVDVSWTPPCDVVLSKTINVIFIYIHIYKRNRIYFYAIFFIYIYTPWTRTHVYFPQNCKENKIYMKIKIIYP